MDTLLLLGPLNMGKEGSSCTLALAGKVIQVQQHDWCMGFLTIRGQDSSQTHLSWWTRIGQDGCVDSFVAAQRYVRASTAHLEVLKQNPAEPLPYYPGDLSEDLHIHIVSGFRMVRYTGSSSNLLSDFLERPSPPLICNFCLCFLMRSQNTASFGAPVALGIMCLALGITPPQDMVVKGEVSTDGRIVMSQRLEHAELECCAKANV